MSLPKPRAAGSPDWPLSPILACPNKLFWFSVTQASARGVATFMRQIKSNSYRLKPVLLKGLDIQVVGGTVAGMRCSGSGDGSPRSSRGELAQGARFERLPRASGGTSRWTVTAQRAGTHPQARRERRRNIMKRRAAVAAELPIGGAHAQPVAARRALRIDALHSPTWQILHAFPPHGSKRISRRFVRHPVP